MKEMSGLNLGKVTTRLCVRGRNLGKFGRRYSTGAAGRGDAVGERRHGDVLAAGVGARAQNPPIAAEVEQLGSMGPQAGHDRAASRLARKQRRLAEGTWGAMKRGEGRVDGERGVLEMIEGMEGPALGQKLGEARAEKPKKKTDSRAAEGKQQKTESKPAPQKRKEAWQTQKESLTTKFGDQTWNPRKRLSPDTLDGIRHLHASDPVTYSTEQLSTHFAISPENIRRILKSKWRPSEAEKEARSLRWERRGERKWSEMAEQGMRPPGRWRRAGVGSVKGEGKEVRPAWKKGPREEGAEYVKWQGPVGEEVKVGV